MPKVRPTAPHRDYREAFVCAALISAVWLVFWRVCTHGFVNFDDEVYVYQNPEITAGFTVRGALGAFTHSHARNWHPLTTLSHMADCQFFGLWAGGHHLTNVLLHSLSAALLYLWLRSITAERWPSAFSAALFALHPLRVESVAWVAERKDVLSGFFFLLTLLSYSRYVRGGRSRARYVASLLAFAGGLLCKPMLVTVPFVLLLLDWWPLRRLDTVPAGRNSSRVRNWGQLLIEKLPFIALAALSCGTTLLAQSGATGALEPLPLSWRIENAIVTIFIYLRQFLWPVDLAAFYPHPGGSFSVITVGAAAIGLIALTGLALGQRARRPWLVVGWLWYLAMLLPVLGVLQIGLQGHADRYTYLPQIGICLAVSWSLRELVGRARVPPLASALSAVSFLIVLGGLTWKQASYWHDSQTLWNRANSVTSNNEVAEHNLGLVAEHEGKLDEAISHYERAIAIESGRGQNRYSLPLALAENNLGNIFAAKRQSEASTVHYERAVAYRPDYADAWYNLGVVLQESNPEKAVDAFEHALRTHPDDAAAHGRLGDALCLAHDEEGARRHYEEAVRLAPDAPWAIQSLAWQLATSSKPSVRNPELAVELCRKVSLLPDGQSAAFGRVLGAAFAACGDFQRAIATGELAAQRARAVNDERTLQALEADLGLYRENVPVRRIAP